MRGKFYYLKISLGFDLIADPDCLIASIDASSLFQNTGGSLSSTVEKSEVIKGLQNSIYFKNLSEKRLNEIADLVKIESFENGKKITKQGDSSKRAFYIVKKGKVDSFVDSALVKTYTPKHAFGELAFIGNVAHNANNHANGKVEVFTIEWNDDFSKLFSPYYIEYTLNKANLSDVKVEMKDLDFVCQLGKGTYGVVVLVKSKRTKSYYAVKCINKNQIFYDRLSQAIDMERELLSSFDNPFIVKLTKALKNKNFIFFLMEYIKGKELFEALREIESMSVYHTQFYSGTLLLAVEALHSHKILHRDLKPENIMVMENVSCFDYPRAI